MADKVWIPERWDAGKWDQAHWDGQLGFNAGIGSVTISGSSANLLIHRGVRGITGSIVIDGTPAGLLYSRALHAEVGSIVIDGPPVGLHYSLVMPAGAGSVVVDGTPSGVRFHTNYFLHAETIEILVTSNWVNLIAFIQPVTIHEFGVRRVIPNRW